MSKLVEQSLTTASNSEKSRLDKLHERAKFRIKECFGEEFQSDLSETGKPCHFRIKDTAWNLVYGFCGGFTLWHKDYRSQSDDNRFCAWQIVNMETLGVALNTVFKSHGK